MRTFGFESIRRLLAATWVGLSVLAACGLFVAAAADGEAKRLENVRQLLREYRIEHTRQDRRITNALTALAELRPSEELIHLLDSRDRTVFDLHGPFFAEICSVTGRDFCVEPLIRTLYDIDPDWRSFACAALGDLGIELAIPHLLNRLHDSEVVPSAYKMTVAVSAAMALLDLGRCDGMKVLMEYADENEYWALMYLRQLKQLAGDDFGTDIDRWREWYESNPAVCRERRAVSVEDTPVTEH